MSPSSTESRRALALAAAGYVLFVASPEARAANPNCSSLPGTIIYGAGGSAQQPLLAQIGTQLAKAASPISIVYSDSGSACAGYNDLVTPTSITGTALYWDGSGSTLSCTLDAGGDPVTFAIMGNGPTLCSGVTALAAGFGQFLGPVQPIDFVVPSGSSQQSISTEAAYYIWGFGASAAGNTVSPWGTTADIFTRSASSFVGLFVSLDTGVPVATVAAHGTLESTNSATVAGLNDLNGTPDVEYGIGFVSGEVADGNRSEIRVLAYQHTGQTCGYWPDSTVDAFDKVNVRSGQYWLWSPVHFYAAVNGSGQISDANTASFIGLFTGAATAPAGVDVFQAEIGAYTVPICAMHAWRDGDLAAPYSYAPPSPCSCEFDFATNNASKPASCTTCTSDSQCTTGHCRNIGPPLDVDAGAAAGDDAGSVDAGSTTNVGYCEAY
jgi:ABC-type phosphate transport system substrate-binding protein